jgi:hypothetical protein
MKDLVGIIIVIGFLYWILNINNPHKCITIEIPCNNLQCIKLIK